MNKIIKENEPFGFLHIHLEQKCTRREEISMINVSFIRTREGVEEYLDVQYPHHYFCYFPSLNPLNGSGFKPFSLMASLLSLRFMFLASSSSNVCHLALL